MIHAVSADLISEILRLGDALDWGGKLPLEWAFRKIARQGITGKRTNTSALFERATNLMAPLKPQPEMKPLDVDEVAAFLEDGGAFDKHFPGF